MPQDCGYQTEVVGGEVAFRAPLPGGRFERRDRAVNNYAIWAAFSWSAWTRAGTPSVRELANSTTYQNEPGMPRMAEGEAAVTRTMWARACSFALLLRTDAELAARGLDPNLYLTCALEQLALAGARPEEGDAPALVGAFPTGAAGQALLAPAMSALARIWGRGLVAAVALSRSREFRGLTKNPAPENATTEASSFLARGRRGLQALTPDEVTRALAASLATAAADGVLAGGRAGGGGGSTRGGGGGGGGEAYAAAARYCISFLSIVREYRLCAHLRTFVRLYDFVHTAFARRFTRAEAADTTLVAAIHQLAALPDAHRTGLCLLREYVAATKEMVEEWRTYGECAHGRDAGEDPIMPVTEESLRLVDVVAEGGATEGNAGGYLLRMIRMRFVAMQQKALNNENLLIMAKSERYNAWEALVVGGAPDRVRLAFLSSGELATAVVTVEPGPVFAAAGLGAVLVRGDGLVVVNVRTLAVSLVSNYVSGRAEFDLEGFERIFEYRAAAGEDDDGAAVDAKLAATIDTALRSTVRLGTDAAVDVLKDYLRVRPAVYDDRAAVQEKKRCNTLLASVNAEEGARIVVEATAAAARQARVVGQSGPAARGASGAPIVAMDGRPSPGGAARDTAVGGASVVRAHAFEREVEKVLASALGVWVERVVEWYSAKEYLVFTNVNQGASERPLPNDVLQELDVALALILTLTEPAAVGEALDALRSLGSRLTDPDMQRQLKKKMPADPLLCSIPAGGRVSAAAAGVGSCQPPIIAAFYSPSVQVLHITAVLRKACVMIGPLEARQRELREAGDGGVRESKGDDAPLAAASELYEEYVDDDVLRLQVKLAHAGFAGVSDYGAAQSDGDGAAADEFGMDAAAAAAYSPLNTAAAVEPEDSEQLDAFLVHPAAAAAAAATGALSMEPPSPPRPPFLVGPGAVDIGLPPPRVVSGDGIAVRAFGRREGASAFLDAPGGSGAAGAVGWSGAGAGDGDAAVAPAAAAAAAPVAAAAAAAGIHVFAGVAATSFVGAYETRPAPSQPFEMDVPPPSSRVRMMGEPGNAEPEVAFSAPGASRARAEAPPAPVAVTAAVSDGSRGELRIPSADGAPDAAAATAAVLEYCASLSLEDAEVAAPTTFTCGPKKYATDIGVTEEVLLALWRAGAVDVVKHKLFPRAPFEGAISTPPETLRKNLVAVSDVAAAAHCTPEIAGAVLTAAGVPMVRVAKWGGEHVVRRVVAACAAAAAAAVAAAAVAAANVGITLRDAAAELQFDVADVDWMASVAVLVALDGGGSVTRGSVDTALERLYAVRAMASDIVRQCPDTGMDEAVIASAIDEEITTAGLRCCVRAGGHGFLQRSDGEMIVRDLVGRLLGM